MKVTELFEAPKSKPFPKGFDQKYSIAFEDGPQTETIEQMFQTDLRASEIPYKFGSEWNGTNEFLFKNKEDFEAAKRIAKMNLPKEATRGTGWFTSTLKHK